jgi:hypothetical protein
MVYPLSPHLFCNLEERICRRTDWRVRELIIYVLSDPDRAILRGYATSSLARQLAEHLVRDYFPHLRLENAIVVDNQIQVLPGMPSHCDRAESGSHGRREIRAVADTSASN